MANTAATNAVAADNATAEGIFASFNDGPISVPSGLATVASLNVPAGKYAVFGKLWVQDVDPGFDVNTFCQLEAGSTMDQGQVFADDPDDVVAPSSGVIALELVHEFGGTGGTINLSCDDDFGADEALFIKIIAMRGPSLTNAASPRVAPRSLDGREG